MIFWLITSCIIRYHQGHISMKELLRNDLKSVPNSRKIYEILHTLIGMDTSISDQPTLKFFVQTFFLAKVGLKNTLPTYSLGICPNFCKFFLDPPLTHYIIGPLHNKNKTLTSTSFLNICGSTVVPSLHWSYHLPETWQYILICYLALLSVSCHTSVSKESGKHI